MGASGSFSWEECPWEFVLWATAGVLSVEFPDRGLCARHRAGLCSPGETVAPRGVACELPGGKMKINENHILSPSSLCVLRSLWAKILGDFLEEEEEASD